MAKLNSEVGLRKKIKISLGQRVLRNMKQKSTGEYDKL